MQKWWEEQFGRKHIVPTKITCILKLHNVYIMAASCKERKIKIWESFRFHFYASPDGKFAV